MIQALVRERNRNSGRKKEKWERGETKHKREEKKRIRERPKARGTENDKKREARREISQ